MLDRLTRLAFTSPLRLALWTGALAYLATHVFQAVSEIRMVRFARRFRRSPLLRDLAAECRWRRWKLTASGCPEPDQDEVAAYVAGDLAPERADQVLEWASLSHRVGDRLLATMRAHREAGRQEGK